MCYFTPGKNPRYLITLCLVFAVLIGCGNQPHHSSSGTSYAKQTQRMTTGKNIAKLATRLKGIPYRYGGRNKKGFDCSGLVYYSHQKMGIGVPRTSLEQFKSAYPIQRKLLHPGDLVFFYLNRKRVSHVGIYVGKNKFVHAPKSGKTVTTASLNDPFWRQRYAGAGRFY